MSQYMIGIGHDRILDDLTALVDYSSRLLPCHSWGNLSFLDWLQDAQAITMFSGPFEPPRESGTT